MEIGSNTTIDRATMGSTIIHKGVKLDNKVNRLVLLSTNIDRYKKYLKLITFMQK